MTSLFWFSQRGKVPFVFFVSPLTEFLIDSAVPKCVFYSLKSPRTDRLLSSFQRSFARSTEKNMDVKAMEASLIKDNPVLLPLNKEKTVYGGFITVQASIYTCILDITLTNYIKICTVAKFSRQLDVSYSCFVSLALAR